MAEGIDTMFQDAVEALRQNDTTRAKDILTRLIKADANNATYWIWMSAAVDTLKERIYCLETALKLDPENATAKRGLLLLGARPPDENIQPFSLNRARVWEEKLFLANEQPRETGVRGVLANPATRLMGVVVAGALLLSVVVLLFVNPRTAVFRGGVFNTPGPSPTFTPTPTFVNASGGAAETPGVATPLAALLGISYSPTPLYVNTPRSPASADMNRAAQAAFKQGNWDEYLRQMEQLQKLEPEAADIPYQIGESYRLSGDCAKALFYFNESLKVDNTFAPGYLGLARARLCMDAGADPTKLYAAAIQNDAAYGEIYLDRANYYLTRKEYKAALPDLDQAARLMPGSALVQLAYAQAYLLQGNNPRALQAARRANATDLTLLPSYIYLGRAYIANEQYTPAIQPLRTYLLYEPKDGSAYALLGESLAKTEDYRGAIEALNKGIRLDPSQVRTFIYLGVSYLRLGNMAGAEVNFKRAIEYFPDSFDANIGLTEIFYKKGTFGSAYLQSETAKAKAKNNTQLALALYWRALSQQGRQHPAEAIQDWKTLLSMPVSAMTPQMRKDAQEHLRTIVVPSNTPTPKSASPTPKPKGPSPTATVTPTNRPGKTATPAPASPTPAPTKTP
jgi:tetratricopeptide (TPR) repeat protein